MESTPLPENRRVIPRHWVVLGLLVVVHAGLGAWLNALSYQCGLSIGNILGGFLSSQPVLFAFWAAFAPQRFYHRFLWALLLCIVVSFISDSGFIFYEKHYMGVFMFLDLVFFAVTTPILLLIRRFSGWQIKPSHEVIATLKYQRYQFGIKHLILLITIAAIGFGLLRSLLLANPRSFAPSFLDYVHGVVLFITGIAPVILLGSMVLVQNWNSSFSIIRAFIIFGVIELVSTVVVKTLSPPNYSTVMIKQILYNQFGAVLSVLLTTLVMRWCGFRMIRVPKTAAVAGET
jgi:hypothetical protein